jgi:hypothetical protein
MPSNRPPAAGAAVLSYAVTEAAQVMGGEAALETARRLGFSSLMALGANAADPAAEREDRRAFIAGLARDKPAGLELFVCLRLDRIASACPMVRDNAGAFRSAAGAGVVDPRRPIEAADGL